MTTHDHGAARRSARVGVAASLRRNGATLFARSLRRKSKAGCCAALLVISIGVPAYAASLQAGGYGRPSNLQETFGVYGDLGLNFASVEGRADPFAFRLAVTNKGNAWGSLVVGVERDLRDYEFLSLWVRSERDVGVRIGLTDRFQKYKPRFAEHLSEYLPGGVSTNWSQIVVPLEDFVGASLKKAQNVVVEVGTSRAGNRYGDVIFIDDIRLLESHEDRAERPDREAHADREASPGRRNIESNLKRIRQTIQPRTGLVQASVVSPDSYTFVNATSLLALLEYGDVEHARRIAKALVSYQNDSGSWPGAWDYATGNVLAPNESVGEAAWACMALLQLYGEEENKKYLRAVRRGIAWANEFQILDPASTMCGAYTGGTDASSRSALPWISSEHQADMLCLLYYAGLVTKNAECFARAKLCADWIAEKAWDTKERRFKVGYAADPGGQWIDSEYNRPTDVQAWLPMALAATRKGDLVHAYDPQVFSGGIDWIRQYEKTVPYKGRNIRGFSTVPTNDTSSVNLDHMIYLIKAARLLGMDEFADTYSTEIDKARNPSGVIEVWMIGPEGMGWPYDYRYPHSTPIDFDTMGENPFALKVEGAMPDSKAIDEALIRLKDTGE